MSAAYDKQQVKADFDRDGHVAIRGFLGPDELAEVQRQIDRYAAEVAPTVPAHMVYYEDKNDLSTLQRLGEMNRFDDYFDRMMRWPKFVELSVLLLETPVTPYSLLWFNKPKDGLRTPAHQDGFYHKIDPPHATSLWLALDPVDTSNGCVRHVTGSHKHGLRPHAPSGVLGFSQGITDYSDADRGLESPSHGQPGDLLVHHALTIHLADGNTSDRPRRAMGIFHYSATSKSNKAERMANQQELAVKLAQENKI